MDPSKECALSDFCPVKQDTANSVKDNSHALSNNGSEAQTCHYLQSWRLVLVILSLCLGTLLVAIDTTIIAVAVPAISTHYKAFEDIQWYGSAYLLTVTAFQPAFGSIYRFFGAKEVYLLSILIFEIGSILSAAAPTSIIFILGRAVSGIGAAGLYQGALAIVGLTVELTKRPLYLGVVLSVFGIAVCFGPPLGGVFTDHTSWRWCFWINVPIGALSTILIILFLRMSKQDDDRSISVKAKIWKLDHLGITTIIAAVCCLMLALQWGQISGDWRQSKIVGTLVGAALFTIIFGIIQWRKGDSATVPLRILRQRTIAMGSWYLFFLEMAIYVDLFYVPFYFQTAQLTSATSSGVKAIPLGLAQIIAIVVVGAVVSRWGQYVPFMISGQLVAIIGTVLLIHITITMSYIRIAVYLAISGFGFGMGLQMPFTGVQVVLSGDEIAIGNAIMVFFSQLGAAIAVAVAQSVLTTSLRHDITHKLQISSEPKFQQLDLATILNAGPTSLKNVAEDTTILSFLQECYANAVQKTLYVALGTTIVAIPFAMGMQWLNVKKVDKEKKTSTQQEPRECEKIV